MPAYYNEHDPHAAKWLRNLIDAGLIAHGDVDERSIEDVLPSDIAGYTQCHFFAGIGGWSLALRSAGWADDRPVWTGSCPCQPFSAAGKGARFTDERHLWPAFHHLISQQKPPVVFGEQVASRDGLDWIDLVHADMEGTGYAFGSADLCAAGVGAPHIRQRLYFVADANRAGQRARVKGQQTIGYGQAAESNSGAVNVANYGSDRLALGIGKSRISGCESGNDAWQSVERNGVHVDRLADTEQRGNRSQEHASDHGKQEAERPANIRGRCGGASDRPGPLNGLWRDADWLYCRDGKWRPVEPGLEPLVDGIPASLGRGKSTLGGMARSNRVIRLRGYGNAIVPELAATFIRAYLGGQ